MKEMDKFKKIFDKIEHIIYISDPTDYEILYVNDTTKKHFGENITGNKCYRIFQNLNAPCSFCTNEILFGKDGQSPYTWDHYNEKIDKWFHITDQVIDWDGKEVRFEMAEDITARKKKEIKIKNTKKNLKVILSNLKDSVFVISQNKKILFKNQVAHDYFGEDVVGKYCYEIIRSRQKPCEDCPFKVLSENETCQYRFEKEIKISNSRSVIFDTIATFIEDFEEEKAIIEVLRDITPLKKLNEDLVKSEKKYRNLIEGLNEAIYKMDLETGEYIYMSPAAKNIFGYDASNFLDNPLLIQKIIHPDFISYFQEKWEDLMDNRVENSYEYKIIDSTGKIRWIRQSNVGIYDENDNLKQIEGICRDITISKETKKELEKQKKWLETTLVSIGDGVIATNTSAEVVFINKIAEKLTGWTNEEAEGRKVHEIFNVVNETTEESVKNPIDRVLKSGKIIGLGNHSVLISKYGKRRNIADSGAPIKDSEGQVIGVVLVFRDITKQYKMQQKIAKSEEKYRDLFESITDGIGMTDLEGNIIDCNQAFTEITGYTLDELKSIRFQDITPERWHKMESDILQNQVMKDGHSDEYEKEYIRKDGSIIPVSLKTWIIEDDNKNLKGFWAIVRDISDRKKNEEELIDKTRILSAINEILSITLKGVSVSEVAKNCLAVVEKLTKSEFGFIGEFNENGKFDTIALSNPGWERCRIEETNLPEMIINMDIRGLWSLPYNDKNIHIINSPKSHPKRVGIPKGHPEMKSIITTPLISQNDIKGIICLGNREKGYTSKEKDYLEALSSPITEVILRTRAENDIIRFNEELEYNINERIKELTCLYDISEIIQNEDDTIEVVLQEIVNRIPSSFQYPEITAVKISYDNNEFKSKNYRASDWYLEEMIKSNSNKIGEIQVTYLEERPEELHGPFLEEEVELLEGISNIIARYIEKTLAKKSLKETMKALKRSNNELQQFAYIASHDLQEPMRTVGSFTQIIRDRFKDKLTATDEKYFNYIIDGTKRMKDLINDLLSFSRITTRGKEFKNIDLNKILKLVIKNLQSAIRESNAIINYDDLPHICGDSTQMFQVFQNLLSNAIKFRGEKNPEIDIKVEEREEKWVFSIKDNGIGINPEYFDRIFIIFQRLNHKNEYEGTGIGLAVCKKIIERHNGKIWVESEKDEGSTFYFSILKENKQKEVVK